MNLPWHYLLIFLGAVVEGPGVTLAAAALAGSGILDPYLVFLTAGAGNLSADLGWYMLGFLGRFESSLSWFPPLKRLEPQIARVKTRMNQHAVKMLLISKLFLGIGSIPTLITAGIARVAWWRVVTVQMVGEMIWTGSLVLIGVFLGQYVARLERILQIAGIAGGAILVAGLIFLLRKQFGEKTKFNQNGHS
jgi:membrane protein DedA with SNARE-associated domain